FLASRVIPGEPPRGFEAIRERRRPLIAMAHHPSPIYGTAAMISAIGELAHRFPDVGLALFGPGEKPAGCNGLVEWLGELPHPQALAVIAKSDAFVRPTTVDGDAISVREALALGVPTVASDAAHRPQ